MEDEIKLDESHRKDDSKKKKNESLNGSRKGESGRGWDGMDDQST